MCQTVSAVQQSTVSLFPQKYAEYLHHFPSLENHYRHNTWTAQTQLWVFNISNHIHWEGKVQRLQKRLNSKKKEENAQGKIPFKIKGSRASLTMKYPEVRKRKGIEADFLEALPQMGMQDTIHSCKFDQIPLSKKGCICKNGWPDFPNFDHCMHQKCDVINVIKIQSKANEQCLEPSHNLFWSLIIRRYWFTNNVHKTIRSQWMKSPRQEEHRW